MHYKDTSSSSSCGQNSTCDTQEDFSKYEIWTRCKYPKMDLLIIYMGSGSRCSR